MEWTMLRLLNRDRRRHGLKSLFMQGDLRNVARNHSKDMAQKDYFEHEDLSGKSHADRYKDAQISDVVSGENLAKISGYKYPVHRAEIGLMNSPGHRANILHPSFNCVGIGIHKSQNGTLYYTQNFAYRALILSKNPPESVRVNKALVLHFKPAESMNIGVYRVLDETGVIKEKAFPIKDKNQLAIPFTKAGKYRVQLYTGDKTGKTLKLSNDIKIRVRKGWFE